MQTNIDLKLKMLDLDQGYTKAKGRGIRRYVRGFWKRVTKYVTFDKDAIFKDPNWPYLWS